MYSFLELYSEIDSLITCLPSLSLSNDWCTLSGCCLTNKPSSFNKLSIKKYSSFSFIFLNSNIYLLDKFSHKNFNLFQFSLFNLTFNDVCFLLLSLILSSFNLDDLTSGYKSNNHSNPDFFTPSISTSFLNSFFLLIRFRSSNCSNNTSSL